LHIAGNHDDSVFGLDRQAQACCHCAADQQEAKDAFVKCSHDGNSFFSALSLFSAARKRAEGVPVFIYY
jgi:hypothetical protein